nr:MAG TPA: hypothetical protein [Caudoviricetes sp.]
MKEKIFYSTRSIETLKSLVESFSKTFSLNVSVDDIFYYKLFLFDDEYINFDINLLKENVECIPSFLTNKCNSLSDKLDYIREVKINVLTEKTEKPEWMDFIELNHCIGNTGLHGSTILEIYPKEEKYLNIANCLMDFLYSVNFIAIVETK